MNTFKKLITILCLLLFSVNGWSKAQWAIVINKHSIIYADPEAKSPIGYISKGKKFKVGNVPRNNGSMLPVVVSGRIAYIYIKDLAIAHDRSLLELPSDRYNKMNRLEDYDKDITVFVNTFMSGLISGKYDVAEPTTEGANFVGVTLQGNMRMEPGWYLGSSFSYETTSVGSQQVTNMFFNLGSLYKFYDHIKYYLGYTMLIGFSPNSRLNVDDAFQLSGQAFQAGAGMEAGYLFREFELKAQIGYRFQAYTNFNIPSGLEDFRQTANGFQLAFGIGYNY
jgi:hypothetical protein